MKKIYLTLVAVLCSLVGMHAAVDYTQVYLIGDATPNGWSADNPTPMTLVNGSDAVFTWIGVLKAGTFKFINKKSSWNTDNFFFAEKSDLAVTIGTSYPIVYNSSVDNKFIMSTANTYKVTVDLKKLTMIVESIASEIPTDLWITGSAVPSGIQKLENYPSLFKYLGSLNPGEVKFMTTATPTNETRYIVPSITGSVIGSGMAIQYTTDSNATGWAVNDVADNYKLTVDAINNTLNGEQFTPWDNIYIIGAALSSGWSIDDAPQLTQDVVNKNIYTWSGNLAANADGSKDFKFLGQRNFTGNSLHPYIGDQNILEAKYLAVNPTSDYKWKIANDGNYTITIDLFKETIAASYSVATGINENVADTKIYVRDGSIVVEGMGLVKSVYVYNAYGIRMQSNENVNDAIASNLPHGLYVVVANTVDGVKVKKITL